MKHFLVLNGPNINMTGLREKNVYGTNTYEDLVSMIQAHAQALGCEVTCRQSNSEGQLIDFIQQAYFDHLVALHDAVASVPIPTIEVHMSNIHRRESFRHVSMTASACEGQIVGLGFQGYLLALTALMSITQSTKEEGHSVPHA